MKLRNGIVVNISNTCILPEGIGKSGLTLFTNQGIVDGSPKRLKLTLQGSASEYVDRVGPYQTENEIFIQAFRTGDPTGILSDYKDAYQTFVVTTAALESALTSMSAKIE